MLESLKNQLKKLEKTTIEIRAEGNYPVKARTPVQHVAVYQNDGTATIKASHFVERAAASKNCWSSSIFQSIFLYLDGLEWELDKVGITISKDINDWVDRIDTGRLKKSFRPKVNK